jgi:hypothetical protein
MAAFLFLLVKAFLISVFCHNFDKARRQGKIDNYPLLPVRIHRLNKIKKK